MKKITLIAAFLAAFTMNAQFTDDFEAETVDATEFANWNSIDVDGDGNFWEVGDIDAAATGAEMSILDGLVADSDSWEGAAFTPDNILVSKVAIDLAADASTLSFTMGTYQTNGSFIADRLQVYLTATDNVDDIVTDTPIFDMTVGDVTAATDGPSAATTIDIDISGFAGQSLFLAFRHFDSVDENSVLLDDVTIDGVLANEDVSNIASFSHYNVQDGNGLRLVSNAPMQMITIFNVLGQKTLSTALEDTTDRIVDISSLRTGVYIAQVTIGDNTETLKIIKK
ncbi:choice-of-anchor J domain-containing protein [uncultured Dokdonia sp.]|uniref:T9SS-dependent choice-of-anchor J family protein n=1 Tax=uncultured Dokdonia sp. TaxID=575653 RepID=UPI0026038C10|nr:choice-of-anchor J domain-containing protein [uncultured Dokdonia sp.]